MKKTFFDLLQTVSRANEINVTRGYADFLSDRIKIAAVEPTLIAFFNKLCKLLSVNISHID